MSAARQDGATEAIKQINFLMFFFVLYIFCSFPRFRFVCVCGPLAVFQRLARFLRFRGVKVMIFTSGVVWRVRSASGGYEKRATFLCKTYDF